MTVVAVRMTHNGAPSRLLSDTHDMKPSKKYEASPAAQVRGFERSEPAATKKKQVSAAHFSYWGAFKTQRTDKENLMDVDGKIRERIVHSQCGGVVQYFFLVTK